MILHPLTLVIGLVMAAAWAIYLRALWSVMPRNALTGDDPRPHPKALARAARLGRWTLGLQAAVLLLVLAGISNFWVPVVPGAMCGRGVLQALGPSGAHALILMAATLMLLYCWPVIERLSRGEEETMLAVLSSRWLLLAAPFMAMAAWRWVQAVMATAHPGPVSCCAALYDQLRAGGPAGGLNGLPFSENTWLLLGLGLTLGIAGAGMLFWRQPHWAGRITLLLYCTGLPLWWVSLYKGLTLGVAPYVYQILFHPCPWCLFLVDHYAVGALFFGLPAWATLESAAALSAWMVARRYPQVAAPALRRLGQAGWRIAASAALFALTAAWPVLSGHLRAGG
jgi:hypothetical protein